MQSGVTALGEGGTLTASLDPLGVSTYRASP